VQNEDGTVTIIPNLTAFHGTTYISIPSGSVAIPTPALQFQAGMLPVSPSLKVIPQALVASSLMDAVVPPKYCVKIQCLFGGMSQQCIALNIVGSAGIAATISAILGFIEEFLLLKYPKKSKWIKRAFIGAKIALAVLGLAAFIATIILTGGTISLVMLAIDLLLSAIAGWIGDKLGRWLATKFATWFRIIGPNGETVKSNVGEQGTHLCGKHGNLHMGKCFKCMNRIAHIVLIPCGHASLCNTCYEEWKEENKLKKNVVPSCPICHKKIKSDDGVIDLLVEKEIWISHGCSECLHVNTCHHTPCEKTSCNLTSTGPPPNNKYLIRSCSRHYKDEQLLAKQNGGNVWKIKDSRISDPKP